MPQTSLPILLADDDEDDRLLASDAIDASKLRNPLIMVNDGRSLLDILTGTGEYPDQDAVVPVLILLDLNMPRKSGFECLNEITESNKLKDLHVVIFSTSYTLDRNYEQSMIDVLHRMGAKDYIRKPGDFVKLKELIHQSLTKLTEKRSLNGQKKG